MNSEVADQLKEMRQQLEEQRVGFESKLEKQRVGFESKLEKQRAEMEADRQDAVYPVRFRGFIEAAAKFVALKRAKEMAPAPTGQLLRIGSLEEPDLLDGEGIQAGRTVKGYPSHSRLDAPLATVYSCLEKHWNCTSGQVHQLRDVRLTEPAVAYCIQEETEVMRESIMGLLKMMKPHWKLLTAMVSNRYSRRQREAADEAIIVRYPGIFDRAATMEDGLQDGSEKIEPVVRANTAWER